MFRVRYRSKENASIPSKFFIIMKNVYTSKSILPGQEAIAKPGLPIFDEGMNLLIKILTKLGLLTKDLDYHVVRASMVIIYFFFGYQKWFPYEAETLIPFIKNGPLTSWMYPVFGLQGASWFLGASEWLFGALLFLGFWNKKLGILGAAGSCVTFIMTLTIMPFMPDSWNAAAGGFPAIQGNEAFLLKDLVLFAASLYLLKQDVERVTIKTDSAKPFAHQVSSN